MLRLRGTIAAAGLTLGWLAAAVVAAPPVLDRVPDNAMVVFAIPSADALQKDIHALMTATELPIPPISIEDLLAMGGLTQGLDLTKSAAVVVFAPDKSKADDKAKPDAKADKPAKADGDDDDMNGKEDKDEPGDADADDADEDDNDFEPGDDQIVVLLPVTKYDDLLANFDAKPGQAGAIDQVAMPDGTDGFIKNVGEGYAAMSPSKDLLGKFDAKAGAAALKAKLGKAGNALSDSADFVVIVNMDVVRPMWPELKKEMEEKIKEKAAALPMGEGAADPMDNPAAQWLADTLVRDSRAGVLGFKAGNTGVSLDLAVNFTEGSQMAKVFSGAGKAGGLLSKLPGSTYLFAGAIDWSGAELKAFAKDMTTRAAQQPHSAISNLHPKEFDLTDGASFVVGVPEGGIFGGLLTSAVCYTAAKDASAYVAAAKARISELNGKEEHGVTVTSSYKDASTQVEGVAVDEYAVTFKSDPDNEEMPPQAINAIFGQTGGPSGYIAKADGGVYQTFSKNSDLLATAMKAGKGGGVAGGGGEGNLAGDQLITQVGAAMPPDRIFEGYLGTKGLLDLVVPMATMFTGAQVPPETIPDTLPPVGMGLSSQEGAARLSLFVPAPVIKTAAKIVEAVEQQSGGEFGEGEGGDKSAPKKDDNGPTGQPRF